MIDGSLSIPHASNAGRVLRALQSAKQLPVSKLAQAIRAQHSDAMAALKQLTERGIVQVRHTDGEPVAVLTSKPEEPDDPPKAKPAEEKKTQPPQTKKAKPPAEKPKKARSAAAVKPTAPEEPRRVIRNADVFAALPTSASDAMTCSEIAEAMKLRPSERKKFYCAIERLRKLGAMKEIRSARGHFRYYRARAALKDNGIPEHWNKILDILPTTEKDGIALGDVIERAGLKSGENFSYRDVKTDLEKMMRHGLIGPRKSDGPGCPRKYYRIVGGEKEMNAPIIDTTIATLSHDSEIGKPHDVRHDAPAIFEAPGDNDGDIADAAAVLAADTQARDLREDSIEDEAPDVIPFEHEWANVSLHELLTEMHKRRSRIERDMKTVTAIADATLGMTVMETVDLLDWLSKCLIESHEQNHAKRTAG